MKSLRALLSLPASLLPLLLTADIEAQELSWPYNLPRNVKYFPEHEEHVKRELQAQERLRWHAPKGVKKMSPDQGEKFFLDYWDFAEQQETYSNGSMPLPAAAIAPHTNHDRLLHALFGRSVFARDFVCPADTTSCSSLGSDLCCPTGQDCLSVSDNVCCCPSGETCSADSCGACDTSAGYTECPDSSNGGCCVPGAVCEGTGCVFYGTATTVITLPTTTVTAGESFSTATDGDGTTTYAAPAPSVQTSVSVSGYTTTVTVTQSAEGGGMTTITQPTTIVITPLVSQTTQGSLTCTSGFISCNADLGGGCCPSGQVCGTSNLCLDQTTSTLTAGAGIRPTSVDSSTDTSITAAAAPSTTQQSQTTNDLGCPTGYYMCSAYYLGGCCRVGRDCDTTSCPSTESTAIVSSEPTVVVPVTSTTTVGGSTATANSDLSCPNGWFLCDDNSGCCPSGHACGDNTCTATVSGEQNTGQIAPSSSAARVLGWTIGFFVLAVGSGIGMMMLQVGAFG